MGEIAEMMLDGTLCEGCGEFIGEGDGFPQYCSSTCAQNRGADTTQVKGNMREDPDPDFLAIHKPSDMNNLEMFLYGRQYNFVHSDRTDKKGQPMIGLMFTQKGQKGQRRGLIVCKNKEIQNIVLKTVNDHKIGGNK